VVSFLLAFASKPCTHLSSPYACYMPFPSTLPLHCIVILRTLFKGGINKWKNIRATGDIRSRKTIYGLDDRGVGFRVRVGSRIFSSPLRPDRLWGPPKLLSNGYRGLLPGAKGVSVKLISQLQQMPSSRKTGSIHPLPQTPSWRGA
jgi:hypothetical protein